MSDAPCSSSGQPGDLWVTHDRRYGTRQAHEDRENAEREAAREPSHIEAVAYVPRSGSAPHSEATCQCCIVAGAMNGACVAYEKEIEALKASLNARSVCPECPHCDAVASGARPNRRPADIRSETDIFLAGYDAGRQSVDPNDALDRWKATRCASVPADVVAACDEIRALHTAAPKAGPPDADAGEPGPRQARPEARLDADGTAKPLTELRGVVSKESKGPVISDNQIEGYVVRDAGTARPCDRCGSTMGHQPMCSRHPLQRSSEAQSFRVSDETILKALLRRLGGRSSFTENDIARAEQATLVRRPGDLLEVWLRIDT